MEEIYDRFLLNDYKAMVINDMAAKSDAIVDFYATDSCDKTALKNAIIWTGKVLTSPVFYFII